MSPKKLKAGRPVDDATLRTKPPFPKVSLAFAKGLKKPCLFEKLGVLLINHFNIYL